MQEPLKSRVVDNLRPETKAPSLKNKGKPSKKVQAKRAQKKLDEQKKKVKTKVRHRDSKNIGKRRQPNAQSNPATAGAEDSGE